MGALRLNFNIFFKNPALTGSSFMTGVEDWQEAILSTDALARVAILRSGAVASGKKVLVTYPMEKPVTWNQGKYRKDKRATVNRFSVGFHMPGLTIVQTVGLSP